MLAKCFPSLQYDGGLTISILSGKDNTPTKFNICDCVFVQDNQMYDILEVNSDDATNYTK